MPSSRLVISTPAALEDLVASLQSSPALGLDTEFLRERTYRAELCLLQVTSPQGPVCVDEDVPQRFAPVVTLKDQLDNVSERNTKINLVLL